MQDVYTRITERILALLRAGTVPWQRPWRTPGGPRNLSGRPYRGINALLLAGLDYPSPYFLTYRQAQARGGHVRRGERGVQVVLWRPVERRAATSDAAPEGEQGGGERYLLVRTYTVFNLSQCQLPAAMLPPPVAAVPEPIEACERIVAAMPDPPRLLHGGPVAAYAPVPDLVLMPHRRDFRDAASYYATLFHELAHATGHPRRLDRPTLAERCPFGSSNYSREELVAELGAAFCCGQAGIAPAILDASAAYVRGWLRALGDDPRLVVAAAGQAQRAADCILGRPAGGATGQAETEAQAA